MATHDPEKPQDAEYLAELHRRFDDRLAPAKEKGRWAALKDRLAIVAVILVLAFLVFLMIDGSIVNFRCTFSEFVALECNRWTGEEHPSLRQLD